MYNTPNTHARAQKKHTESKTAPARPRGTLRRKISHQYANIVYQNVCV